MPQNRDPKTGRYTSGGGSSYEAGASASTNSRIQKAKLVGAGNNWRSSQIRNPLSQLTDDEGFAIDRSIKGREDTVSNAPVKDVSLTNIKSMQSTLRPKSVRHFAKGGSADKHPVILQTANGYKVVLDGNHRVNQALREGKQTIKAHYSHITDFNKK